MRLIDADAFESDIRKRYCAECDNYNGVKCKACWVDDMLGEIEDALTIDAIPIEWIQTNYAWLITEGKNEVVDVLTEMIEEWRKGKKNDNACNR